MRVRKINKIIIHMSASSFGNAIRIDEWHKERGFDKIGYHLVILNGHPHDSKNFYPYLDGAVETGRPLYEVGAHAKGHNHDSIGICLITDSGDNITDSQYASLRKWLISLMNRYSLTIDDVYGHYEFDSNKTCPEIDMAHFRDNFVRDINVV